jgi:hypothetical protein
VVVLDDVFAHRRADELDAEAVYYHNPGQPGGAGPGPWLLCGSAPGHGYRPGRDGMTWSVPGGGSSTGQRDQSCPRYLATTGHGRMGGGAYVRNDRLGECAASTPHLAAVPGGALTWLAPAPWFNDPGLLCRPLQQTTDRAPYSGAHGTSRRINPNGPSAAGQSPLRPAAVVKVVVREYLRLGRGG